MSLCIGSDDRLLGEHGETACRSTMDHGPCVHWTEDLAVVHSAGVSTCPCKVL